MLEVSLGFRFPAPFSPSLRPENANHALKHELRPRSKLGPAEAQASYNARDARLGPEIQSGFLGWLATHA